MTAQDITNRVYIQTDPVNNTWLDITGDVISKSVKLSKGISSSDPLRRIAEVGQFTFLLKNDGVTGLAHRYTPGHSNCTPGFAVRAKVKLVSTWRGISKTQWAGWIPPDGIEQITPGPIAMFASVTAYDHAFFWTNNPVTLADILSDKNMGEVGLVLMDLITAQPSRVDLTSYVETFENTNDTVVENTTVYSEANKATLSELGHMRVKYEPGGVDDIVALEGRQYFDTLKRFTAIPEVTENCPHILSEAGDTIIAEDGGGIVADKVIPFDYLTGVQNYKIVNGANYASRWIGKSYPRQVGSTTVIFRLNKAIKLDAGETRENLRVRYIVPEGFRSITAKNVSLTDYAMNSKEDGTGTDLTTDLTITASYGSGDALFELLENTGETDGYVTKIELSGDPIYIGDTVSQVVEIASGDDTLYGKIERVLDQKYQSDPIRTLDQITLLATRYGAQRVNTVETIEFCANSNEVLAAIYAMTDQTARLPIHVAEYDISEDYYVNGIENWYDGDFTFCRLYLKPARVETYVFWKIGVPGNSELGFSTRLGIPL